MHLLFLRRVRRHPRPEAEQLASAKRRLDEAGIVLTPVNEKQPNSAPSATAPALPITSAKTPA